MNNDELAQAIHFALDNSKNCNDGYSYQRSDSVKLMLEHLKELLKVQLERAKSSNAP